MHDYENWLSKFERANAKQKHALLLDLQYSADLSGWPHVRAFLGEISRCGQPKLHHWFGETEPRPAYCGHPLCPKCRGRVANESKRRGLAGLLKAADGSLDPSEISAVSINGCLLTDAEHPRDTRNRMAKAIRDAVRDHGLDIRGVGRFEVTRTSDRKMRLDIHCEIHHPGLTRPDVLDVLKDVFPDDRAVQVKAQNFNQEAGTQEDLERSIEGFLGYAAKACIAGKKVDNETIEDVFEIISLYQQIRTQGCKGLKFEIGLRKRKTKAPDVSSGSISDKQVQELKKKVDIYSVMKVIVQFFNQPSNSRYQTPFLSYNPCTYIELVSPCSTQFRDQLPHEIASPEQQSNPDYVVTTVRNPQTLDRHMVQRARAPPALRGVGGDSALIGTGRGKANVIATVIASSPADIQRAPCNPAN